MDALDVRILRTMTLLPYGPEARDPSVFKPTVLARELDTPRDTVEDRIDGMEEDGVILGYQVFPNLEHLGLSSQAYLARIDGREATTEAVEALGELDRLLVMHEYLDNAVCVEYAYRDEDEREQTLEAITELTGDPEPRRFYDGVMPDVDRELSTLDWRILASLRDEALKPLREVADDVDVTRETVKRRYDRMAGEDSFVTVPLLDPSQAPGLILFELMVFSEPETDREVANEVLEAYEEHRVFHYVPASGHLGDFNVLCVARTPARIDELRSWGEHLPGVDRVEAGALQPLRRPHGLAGRRDRGADPGQLRHVGSDPTSRARTRCRSPREGPGARTPMATQIPADELETAEIESFPEELLEAATNTSTLIASPGTRGAPRPSVLRGRRRVGPYLEATFRLR